MKKYIISIILILLANEIYSNPYTDYSLKGSLNLNGNIYSSDFNQIGSYKNCCPRYENAFGLAPSFFAGGEKRNAFNLFGYDIAYSLMLGYNNLSASYGIEQHIGNDLGENSYEKIKVNHELDIAYSLLSLENSFWFNPDKNLPLGIKLGFNIGIPLAKSFDQKEVLLSPTDATFSDGSKIFNPATADIPNASAIFAAISLGARYKVHNFSNYDLYANAGFNYGLTSIASDINLNIHQATIGISLHYNMPKAELPRPPVPPTPEAPAPPPPPIAKKPEMNIYYDFDYNKVNPGDTLNVVINKYEYITLASLMPVLVFEKDSDKVLSAKLLENNIGKLYDDNFRAYESINFPENYSQIIAKHLEDNPNTKFKIIAESEDESSEVLKLRLNSVVKKLKSAGIEDNKFTSEIISSKNNKTRNPLLTEENRKIFFEFPNDGGLIEVRVSTDYLVDNFNKVMNITPIYFAEDTIRFEGKTTFNNSNETAIKSGTNQVVLSWGMFVSKDDKPNVLKVHAEVEDSEGNIARKDANFYLTHEEKQSRRYINLNRDDKSSDIEEFIVGFTDFDKSELSLINTFAIDYVRSKAIEGRSLEIIPLTDSIGTQEYNRNLAQKRAESALRLIGKDIKNYSIIIPDNGVFSNETPYGRMMNRAVIIRIK